MEGTAHMEADLLNPEIPAFQKHPLRSLPARAGTFAQALVDLLGELLRRSSDLAKANLAHLRKVGGDAGKAGGKVLPHLEGICTESQLVQLERHDRHVESAAVHRQILVPLAPEQMHVRESPELGDAHVRRDL